MRYLLTIVLSITVIKICMAEPEKSIEPFQNSFQFQNFMGFAGTPLQAFQQKYVPKVESVFYPFGGPDLLHPLFLFPDATIYVLVGQEPSGEALSPSAYSTVFKNLASLLR